MGKQYDDDDGRTIADMNVDGMPWYRPKQAGDRKEPGEEVYLTKEEKKGLYKGVLGASLLISSIFLIGFFILIVFMVFVWFA